MAEDKLEAVALLFKVYMQTELFALVESSVSTAIGSQNPGVSPQLLSLPPRLEVVLAPHCSARQQTPELVPRTISPGSTETP